MKTKKVFISIIMLVVLLVIILTYWSLSSTSKTFTTCNLINFENANLVDFKKHDSVLISASYLYKPNQVKNLMQGEQYRKAWAAAVKVPIVFLDTLFGGVEILEEGGGKQTQSLKLKASNEVVYALRSVNKNPQPLIPEVAEILGLENIIVDGISAQHPYGAILAAELQQASGILHTNPKMYFVPKQEALNKFNDQYGNRLFLLEYETEGPVNWTPLKNIYELLDTEDLQELKLEKGKGLKINKPALIRARLFDLIIGDWDRHTKQWGWAIQKNNGYEAFPIAGDRDNAFFNIEGIIPTLIANKNIEPKLRPFAKDIEFLEGLVYPFDRYFLHNTNEALFIKEAKHLRNTLTDAVLYKSLKVWPKNIVELDGESIIKKIISRRDNLESYAKEFKRIIDEKGVVNEPLKGSEDLNLNEALLQCFDCE